MKEYIVETKNGKISGIERNGGIDFLGIPYAQPPVNELRFKRARPANPWEGIYKAHEYGDVSAQFDRGIYKGSEDCLTLNIQRPIEGENFPVMVWIHGGGYNTGSASDEFYSGKEFVKEGILFVSIQYRLNVLGFYDFTTYKNGHLFESNCGISDQLLAMQWIHENIAEFGGNPDQVTIAGESAGATSMAILMAAPSAKGTFQQAIIESAIPQAVFTHTKSRENIDLFLEGMGWTEEDLPKLLTMDPYEMQKGNTYVAENFQQKNPGIYLPSPVIDDLLPKRPIEAIKEGCAKGIKIIIGTNLHEASMFVQTKNTVFPNSWEMIERMFRINGVEGSFENIKEYYLSRELIKINDMDPALIQFGTDFGFAVPAYYLAEGQRQFGDVWMYRYEYMPEGGKNNGLGAGHAFELPSVFYNKEFGFSRFVFEGVPEEEAEAVMQSIHTPWINFIKYGDPDSENWPRFDEHNRFIRIFDDVPRTISYDKEKLIEVWNGLSFYAE